MGDHGARVPETARDGTNYRTGRGGTLRSGSGLYCSCASFAGCRALAVVSRPQRLSENRDFYSASSGRGAAVVERQGGLNGISLTSSQCRAAALQPRTCGDCVWKAGPITTARRSPRCIACTSARLAGMQVVTVQHGGRRGPKPRHRRARLRRRDATAEAPGESRGMWGNALAAADRRLLPRAQRGPLQSHRALRRRELVRQGLLREELRSYGRAASNQKWLELHGGSHWAPFYTDTRKAQKRFFDHFSSARQRLGRAARAPPGPPRRKFGERARTNGRSRAQVDAYSRSAKRELTTKRLARRRACIDAGRRRHVHYPQPSARWKSTDLRSQSLPSSSTSAPSLRRAAGVRP